MVMCRHLFGTSHSGDCLEGFARHLDGILFDHAAVLWIKVYEVGICGVDVSTTLGRSQRVNWKISSLLLCGQIRSVVLLFLQPSVLAEKLLLSTIMVSLTNRAICH